MADDAAPKMNDRGFDDEATRPTTPRPRSPPTRQRNRPEGHRQHAAEDDNNQEGFDAAAASRGPGSLFRGSLATIFGLVVARPGRGWWAGRLAGPTSRTRPPEQRALFLQVGKQAALNLTTIDFEHADADVKRILTRPPTPSTTTSPGARSRSDVVKQAKSKSTGEIAAAGLESDDKRRRPGARRGHGQDVQRRRPSRRPRVADAHLGPQDR